MAMIQAEHLTFSYPGSFDHVFEDLSLQFDTDWKLGLVGRNGRGKTTFLKLLQGEYEYSGRITASVPFDYFPYLVRDPSQRGETVLQTVCPQAEPWQLSRELALLEVDESVLQRPFAALSHGERTKVLLAALFLNPDRFLLIDEPTNHLDQAARALVSAYLRRKQGFLLVSHDRRFLDSCTDHILSLTRTGAEVQSGNFSSWLENFQRRQQAEQTRNDHLQKDIRRLRQAAQRTALWSDRVEASKTGAYDKGYVGHKSTKMMKRAKSIEARQRQAIAEKSGLLRDAETAETLKLSPLPYRAQRLAELNQVTVSYSGRQVCGPLSLTVCRGDRIALTGRNGSGKSSLLKLLLGQDIPHSGTVTLGSGLVLSYVPQDTAHLTGSLSALIREHRLDESLFKAILRKMDFSRAQFEKNLADFSAGQKKKVLLAKSLCEPAHLYVWDEPLNYIDIYSRMQIEELLVRFAPTMVFVEHDRAFQEAAATRTVSL